MYMGMSSGSFRACREWGGGGGILSRTDQTDTVHTVYLTLLIQFLLLQLKSWNYILCVAFRVGWGGGDGGILNMTVWVWVGHEVVGWLISCMKLGN